MKLNTRIERKEPRLSDGGDFRSIFHLKKNEPGALTVVVRKIGGFWLQLCQNGLDDRAELAGLRGCVPRFNGNVDLQQKTHGSPPDWFVGCMTAPSATTRKRVVKLVTVAFCRLPVFI